MKKELVLSVRGVSKAFGPTRALIDVDIDIYKGEIRGLIGENGSGKSTFSSIIAGAQTADSGEFTLSGEKYIPKNMVDAQNKGVSMIIQEMGTISKINVASNIFAGRLEQFEKYGLLDNRSMMTAANKILEEIGAGDIRAEMLIDRLNFEDRKIVEIARAYVTKPELLIVDETTTALAEKGRRIIYSIINRMYEDGKAVLFISHDLDELMSVCNTVTVLRDGQVVDTLDKDGMSVENMRTLMVGRELQGSYYRSDYDGSFSEEAVLEAHQVSLNPSLENVDLLLHKGEILGIGGLSSCGMHELGRVLFGIDKPVTGHVRLTEKNITVSSSNTAVKHKMAYVSKDRDKEAIILSATIMNNISLPSLRSISKAGVFIARASERRMAQKQIETFSIKCRNAGQLVKELSGGNKQKVVFSKWLAKESDIFILDCPTRGIDVGVKATMYKLMMELKKMGKSIIMISEELVELIGMSDRILILKDGIVRKEFTRSKDLKEQDIIPHII